MTRKGAGPHPPGLTPERLRAGFENDIRKLDATGIDATMCFVDLGETAEATVRDALAADSYDAVPIGAGVRTDPGESGLFETLVNVVHAAVPSAGICFNTGPTDSADAVLRRI